MPVLFANCFGRKRNFAATLPKVTEVQALTRKSGDFLIKPYEDALLKASSSCSISKLHKTIEEGKDSGLLEHSRIFNTEKQRLQTWKLIENDLVSSYNTVDVDGLTVALERFEENKLLDENGHFECGCTVLQTRLAANNLLQAIRTEKTRLLEDAIIQYKQAKKKFDTIKEQRKLSSAALLDEYEVASAEELLQRLHEENVIIKKNPDFPKQELQKATESRELATLNTAIRRWKRLEFIESDSAFVSALRVQNQLKELSRSMAVQALEKNLQEKNSAGIKTLLHGIKRDAILPQSVLNVYENQVLQALDVHYKWTVEALEAVHQQAYETLETLLSNESISSVGFDEEISTENEAAISLSVTADPRCNLSVLSNEELCYSEVIINAKSKSMAVVNEAQRIFSAVQRVHKAFKAKCEALSTVDQTEEMISRQMKEISDKYGETPDTRRSFRHSAKDRSTTLRNIVNAVSDFPEKLDSCIKVVRISLKAFDTVLKQIKETVIGWQKRNVNLSSENNAVVDISPTDFTLVHEVEKISVVVQRLLNVAKAELSLIAFDEFPSSPRDAKEVENRISRIKEILEVLCKHDDDNDPNFVDLCYNHDNVLSEASPKCQKILRNFSKLFSEKKILATKKAAEIQLLELQLACVDEKARINSTKYALKQAITMQSEGELIKALNGTSSGGFTVTDSTVNEAEKELTKIRVNKRLCRDSLRVAIGKKDEEELETALSLAEDLYLAPTDTLLVTARKELMEIRFAKSRRNAAMEELKKVTAASLSARDLRLSLARAKICEIPSSDPAFLKAEETFLKLSTKSRSLKERSVIDLIRLKLGHDRNNKTENSLVTSRARTGEYPRTFLTSEEICKYLKDQINIVKSKGPKEPAAENIRLTLDYVKKLKKDIPPRVVDAALKSISSIEDLRKKRNDVQRKLKLAVESNQFNELASAIAAAETTSGILHLSFDEASDDFYELLAKAKENFAMQHMHRKSDEEEKMKKHISKARRHLKKAMLGEMDGTPLREAVETFRVICTPRIEEESSTDLRKSAKRITIDPVPTHIFGSSNNSSRKNLRSRVNSEKFLKKSIHNASKLYRVGSAKRQSTDTPSFTRGISSAKQNSLPLAPTQDKRHKKSIEDRKTFSQTPNHIVRQPSFGKSKLAYQKPKTSTPNLHQQTSNSSQPKASILRRRPSSALEFNKSKTELVDTIKIAWEEIDDKNIALLRKAERSLKRIEKEEEKQRESTENQELYKSVKTNLAENLKSSIECGDRAELWQAVHEFQRYFGDGMSKEDSDLLSKANKALSCSTYDQYKNNLTTAITERNLNKLEHVIYEIENDTYEYMPDDETEKEKFFKHLNRAKLLASHLSDLGKYRDAVMTMTRSLVSEINSYPSPPAVVKSVMAATYLLLGESEKTVKEWSCVHVLIGKLGRSSLTRRVLRRTPSSVPISVARLAHSFIKDLTFDRVHAINVGASTFYAWSNCMVNEVFERHKLDLPHLTPHKESKPSNGQSPLSGVVIKPPSAEFWQRLARSNHPTPPKRILSGVAKETQNLNKKSRTKSARN